MAKAILETDPYAIEKTKIDGLIKQFNKKMNDVPGGNEFLNVCGNTTRIYVTDNLASKNFVEGNRKKFVEKYGVRITGNQAENPQGIRWFSQRDNKPETIYVNLSSKDEKRPINILVHEVGHYKWENYAGADEAHHKPEFYKMLTDALINLNILWDGRDYNIDFINVKNPLRNNFFGNTCRKPAEKSPRQGKGGPPEGLRRNSMPVVVSTGPNVNWTTRGNKDIPVAYTQIGSFEDSRHVAASVRFKKDKAFTMASYIVKSYGDAAGTAGGVTSGTVGARCHPIESSNSVRAEKHLVVADGHKFYLNDKNCVGRGVCKLKCVPAITLL